MNPNTQAPSAANEFYVKPTQAKEQTRYGIYRKGDPTPINETPHKDLAIAAATHADAVQALSRMLAVYEALMPGLRHIAVANYAEINDAPIAARQVLEKIRSQVI